MVILEVSAQSNWKKLYFQRKTKILLTEGFDNNKPHAVRMNDSLMTACGIHLALSAHKVFIHFYI